MAVLFDLEGTLVETVYERSREAIDKGRREVKSEIIRLGVPEEALGSLIRSTLFRNRALDWAEKNMSQEELANFLTELDAFIVNIEIASAKQTLLYPDTLEALEDLVANGIEMGLVTNTSKEAANCMMENLGLAGFFSIIVTRSDVPRLKPDPAMVLAAISALEGDVGWLVGDTVYDAEAAMSSGLKSIIIRRDGTLPNFNHDYFINSLNDIAYIVLKD